MPNYYMILSGSSADELSDQVTGSLDEGWTLYGGVEIDTGVYYQTVTNYVAPNYYELNRENLSKYYIANNIATGSWPTTSVYPK